MSANYRETTVTGISWQRANRVTIDNPLGGIPLIHFVEEEVVALADGHITRPLGAVMERMTDPDAAFPLLIPDTGQVVGEATYGQVYALLHSLYLHLATQRDIQAAEGEDHATEG